MSKTQRRALSKYVLYLLRELDLREWVIDLKHTSLADDDEAWARIEPTFGQRRARLWLCPDFEQLKPEHASAILIHELLHCHTAGLQHHCEADELVTLMGKPAQVAWSAGFRQFLENAVDAIALVLAREFDVIDWAGKRRYRR